MNMKGCCWCPSWFKTTTTTTGFSLREYLNRGAGGGSLHLSWQKGSFSLDWLPCLPNRFLFPKVLLCFGVGVTEQYQNLWETTFGNELCLEKVMRDFLNKLGFPLMNNDAQLRMFWDQLGRSVIWSKIGSLCRNSICDASLFVCGSQGHAEALGNCDVY